MSNDGDGCFTTQIDLSMRFGFLLPLIVFSCDILQLSFCWIDVNTVLIFVQKLKRHHQPNFGPFPSGWWIKYYPISESLAVSNSRFGSLSPLLKTISI